MNCSSCLVGAGCAIGGILIGRRWGTRSASTSRASVGEKKHEEAMTPQRRNFGSTVSELSMGHVGTSRRRISSMSQSCEDDIDHHNINSDYVNLTLSHLWPHIKKFIENMIRTDVEPALQEKLPGPLKRLAFTKIDLGRAEHCPLKVINLASLLDERTSPEQGVFRCVHSVMGVLLDSECEIELQLILEKLTVGACNAKLKGSLVVEMYHLLNESPLIECIRIFFSDDPELDLTMTGGVGGMLNTGFLKNLIVETTLQQISNLLTLPHRMVIPIREIPDVIKVQAPRPQGILRLVVEQVSGLKGILPNSVKTPWHLSFTIGNHCWKSSTKHGAHDCCFNKDNLVDFIVHDRDAQHLKISLYPEKKSKLWGTYPGEVLLTCFLRLDTLISDGVARWLSMDDNETQDTSNQLKRSRITTVDFQFSSQATGEGDLEILFSSEWGRLSRYEKQAKALSMRQSLFSGWTQSRAGHNSAVAVLLIGLRKAYDLPSDQASLCWCATTVSHVAAGPFDTTIGPDGNLKLVSSQVSCQRSVRPEKAGLIQTCSCGHEFTSNELFCPKCGEKRLADEGDALMVDATWDESHFVPLHDPRSAKLEIVVHNDKSGPIGTVQHDVSELIDQPGLFKDYEEVMVSTCPHQAEQTAASTVQPSIHLLLRIWVLEAGNKIAPCRELDLIAEESHSASSCEKELMPENLNVNSTCRNRCFRGICCRRCRKPA